ncbi:DUF5305 domain-containing protein [Candidatus Saccharibacteria bacterium]|nr:DUF5305 domain-containing protein [Candidatus Saccharibacteria bacterium]
MRGMQSIRRFLTPPIIGCFLIVAGCCGAALYTLANYRPDSSSARLTENNVVEYRVNLKPNNGIISDPYLGMGRAYAFDIVESVEIDNFYTSELSSPEAVSYTYEATVSFVARVTNNGPSTEPGHIVVDELLETLISFEQEEPSGEFKTEESITLSLADYRAKHLATQASLNFPTTGEIRIDFTVVAIGDKYVESESVRSVIVPISEPHFIIRLGGKETQTTVFAGAPTSRNAFLLRLAMCGLAAMVAFVVGAFFARKIWLRKPLYRREIDHLLRNYHDAIITTSTPINPNSYKERVIIKDSREIIKLADTLNEPIIYYEAPEVACFYLPKGEVLYAYFVSKPLEAPGTGQVDPT